jgi:hypothetical protein
MEVFSFIEGFYNPLRRHSRLGNLSPVAYDQQLTHRPRCPADGGQFIDSRTVTVLPRC